MTDAPDTNALLAAMPFAASSGVELLEATAEEVRGRVAWAPERCTAGGVLHGAALMTLADSLGGICAFLNLPKGATTSTIESKTNFFGAVRSGEVTGSSRPLHIGRSTIVVQTELWSDAERRVAHVVQTQSVLQNLRQ